MRFHWESFKSFTLFSQHTEGWSHSFKVPISNKQANKQTKGQAVQMKKKKKHFNSTMSLMITLNQCLKI